LLISRRGPTNGAWYTACVLCQLAATRVGVPLQLTLIFKLTPVLTQGRTGQAWEASIQHRHFRNRRELDRQELSPFGKQCCHVMFQNFFLRRQTQTFNISRPTIFTRTNHVTATIGKGTRHNLETMTVNSPRPIIFSVLNVLLTVHHSISV
jgi:hypothetical protein